MRVQAPVGVEPRWRSALRLFALAVATGGIGIGTFGGLLGPDFTWPLVWILWAPVGYVIVRRRPDNRVGNALLAIGFWWGTGFILSQAAAEIPLGRAAAWLELGNVLAGVVPWFMIIWVLLVFPSGAYAGRAERLTARILLVYLAVVLAAFAVSSTPMEYTGKPSPLAFAPMSGISEFITRDSGASGFHAMLLIVGVALAALVRRWRHSHGVERQQFRWVLWGAATFLITISAGQVLPEGPGEYVWFVAAWAIPLTIGVAVLRYRLYDIDRIVSRTFGYGLLIALLGLVYATGAIWLPAELLGEEATPPFVAASTLAVAALFNPVRRRVIRWMDRRFYRSRYDAEQVANSLASRLREQTEVTQLTAHWVWAVRRTVQPTGMMLWVRT